MTADSDSLFQRVLDLLEEVSEPNSQGWHLALCVFHDAHKPSMRVRETGFVCFACGEKGRMARTGGGPTLRRLIFTLTALLDRRCVEFGITHKMCHDR